MKAFVMSDSRCFGLWGDNNVDGYIMQVRTAREVLRLYGTKSLFVMKVI